MKVTKVTVGRVESIPGRYGNVKCELEADVYPGEDAQSALIDLGEMAELRCRNEIAKTFAPQIEAACAECKHAWGKRFDAVLEVLKDIATNKTLKLSVIRSMANATYSAEVEKDIPF